MLDAVTAVSGSGPAYFFLLMEHMIKAGTELQTSKALTLQTAWRSTLAQRPRIRCNFARKRHIASRYHRSGFEQMLEQHVPEAVNSALHAAHQRSIELAKEFGKP